MTKLQPVVLQNQNSVPFLVFAKGRKLYHAVTADTMIRVVSLETLRGLDQVMRKGEPYPPRRAASHWLNHDHRVITQRAKAILRGLVARKKAEEERAKESL